MVGIQINHQAILAACHGQVNFRQNLRIQQSAVQLTVGIVYAKAIAQGIQVVAFARKHFAGHAQRIDYTFDIIGHLAKTHTIQFTIQKPDVE